jgi:hypothetical protein
VLFSVRNTGSWSYMIDVAKDVALVAAVVTILVAPCESAAQEFPLKSTEGLQPHGVDSAPETYRGRQGLRVPAP